MVLTITPTGPLAAHPAAYTPANKIALGIKGKIKHCRQRRKKEDTFGHQLGLPAENTVIHIKREINASVIMKLK